MITEIRRKDRAMKTSREMEILLEEAAIGRLAVTTKEGPYVVPVNYLFFEGNIYFHSALSGRKVESIQTDARVCFLVDEVGPQVVWERNCGISQIYKSVICFGKAEFVQDPIEKRAILERMVQKYVPTSLAIDDQNIQMTAVVKIVIETMSGKAHDPSPSHTVAINRFHPTKSTEGQ
ncbi:MAG: pyridoxamine 5'-phosphate oxidase family protein [Desulfomonilaceae bacterium]